MIIFLVDTYMCFARQSPTMETTKRSIGAIIMSIFLGEVSSTDEFFMKGKYAVW